MGLAIAIKLFACCYNIYTHIYKPKVLLVCILVLEVTIYYESNFVSGLFLEPLYALQEQPWAVFEVPGTHLGPERF